MRPRLGIFFLILLTVCSAWADAGTVQDKKGRLISVARPYTRIISLYGAHTENLFYLGADDQIIGVSVNDDYPARSRRKPTFSYHDGPEKFLAARPDLVLIRPMIDHGYPDFVRQLQGHGITVASLQPATVDEMYGYWSILGKLTGRQDRAKAMTEAFRQQVAEIASRTAALTSKRNVYFQAIHKRMRTFTPNAMPLFALSVAGGLNVATDATASRNTNIAVYSKEKILAKAQDIDVFLAQVGIMNPVTLSDIMNEPGFHVIKAVKTRQVFLIDENIVSRPVPRLIDGILAIGRCLYPDIFLPLKPAKDTL